MKKDCYICNPKDWTDKIETGDVVHICKECTDKMVVIPTEVRGGWEERLDKWFDLPRPANYDHNTAIIDRADIKSFIASELERQREEAVTMVKNVFDKHWKESPCVGKKIADDGVMITWRCSHCGQNVWDETQPTPICPMSIDPISVNALNEILEALTAKLKP